MVEERYEPSSSFVTYAEAEYDPRKLILGDVAVPSSEDPTIWKVKCTVGRERYSAFCLMQKYVDLQSLGTKLSVVSAFVIERVKGFIYIEAKRQLDVIEACKGLYCIYTSQIAPVPKKEISRLLSLQSKCNEVAVGTWVRVKNGTYKGDLAEVIAVNEARKRATVKLIPRVDLQAIAAKFGGGISSKKAATPAPRLISSTELQEFGPLIQYRRDRDTGQTFEVLDGLMLKDGYLYKKVSISSLSFYCLVPSEGELLMFEPFKKDDSDCQEWLTQLYGEQEGKRMVKSDRGGWKGEGSSSSSMACSLKVHDLVLFNQKDFGVIVGTVKDDSFKVLKEGSEGPVAVTVELRQLKNLSFPKKLTALDHCLKTISINDTVGVLEGPLQGRQGIVKQIFRGIIFLYDENEQENNGYICCKSQICEKIESCDDAFNGKGGESSSTGIDDFLSSPKSPVSTKKPMQTRENSNSFNRENKDGNITIGQSLRIRVGPMKGYLCCVLAVYHSAITVKLDSHRKILTVKREHLSQVHGKSSAVSLCEDAESVKPFGLLGTQDCSGDRMAGVRTSSEGERCGAGALSTVRNSWPAFQFTGLSLEPESNFANPRNSVKNNTNKAVGVWESKAPPSRNSSWHNVVAEEKAVGNRSSRDGFSGSKAAWNGPLAQPKNQTLMKKELEYIERTGKFYCRGMPSSRNQGFGGWNKHRIGNNDNACHQGSWDETRTFDGGRGLSGRRGRGGSSRGGRSQFGSVRTFGQGHGASARTSSPNLSSWSGGRAGCQGSGNEFDGGGDDRFGKGVHGGRGGSDRGGFGGRGQSNLRGCAGGGGGGSDRGGFQGRGTSERGGFRGRGRGNGWSNQRTGFAKDAGVSDVAASGWTSQASVFNGGESKRSDGGGYGGRGGSGRGGFGGQGRSNGGGGCRGGARFDGGDFRGRGKLERGGLGGRGRGRRDQNSEWSSIMASSWNKGPTSGEWWKNVDGGGSASGLGIR